MTHSTINDRGGQPGIYIMSKRGKVIVRIRKGCTSDTGVDNCTGLFKHSKEAKEILKELIRLNKCNSTDIELLKFGSELEKMYPKNDVVHDFKGIDFDFGIAERLKYDPKKYEKLMKIKNLG